ncbi:MAG TPA: TIR domain-containing protein [Thermoanaerobaculia bacterium]|nr:TIR domain-containing protein [Thermoanaerobaculia bacterium]
MVRSPAPTDKTQLPKTKVFVSYSRKDIEFADRLVAALETRDIEVKIDRRDLPLLEEWQRELLGFIQQADAVILIISPNSIKSRWIDWEIQRVLELNKRLAPVVFEPVPDDQIPDAVGKINLVFFNPPNDFDERTDALVAALNTDIIWIKEHTRIGELARRWNDRGRSAPDVLRGRLIEEAERWIAQSPANAPRPTTLHAEFIQASRYAETRRWRMTAGVLGLTLAIVAALGVAALLLKQQANRERDTALTTQSRFLADQARQSLKSKDYATGLSLALEGLPKDPGMSDRPLVPEALIALQHALYNVLEARVVDVGAVLPRYGSHWIDPDSISPSLESDVRGAAPPDSGLTQNVWLLSSGPLLPWELLTAAHHAQGTAPETAVVASTKALAVQARGDNRVQVVDIATRTILSDVPGHEGNAYGAALSSDGSRLVTLGQGRVRARLWDTAKSSLITNLEGYEGGIWMVAFSENGTRFITADGQGRTARIFDGKGGRLLTTLGPQDEAITFAALSPDGAMAVTGSPGGTVRLWRLEDRQPRLLRSSGSTIRGGRFSSDGSRIAMYFQDGVVQVDSTKEEREPIVLRHHSQVNDVGFTRDGAMLVTASDDQTAIVWDARRGEALALLAGHTESVERACFSPDNATVITFGASTAREWHLVSPLAPVLRGESARVNTAAFSPDGSKLFTGSEKGEVLVWDVRTGKKHAALVGHRWGVDTIVFTEDGRKVLTGGRDGRARLWYSDGRLIHEFLEDVGASFMAATLSGDGTRVAATSARSGLIVVWDAKTFCEVRRIPDPQGVATKALAFSKDTKRLLAGYGTGKLKQWDLSTGKLVPEIQDVPETFAFEEVASYGNRFVRIGPGQNHLATLRSPSGVVTTLFESNSSLRSVRFSPDGRCVAISDVSGVLHILPLASEARRLTYAWGRSSGSPGGGIVRFSADGKMVAVGASGGNTYVVDATSGTLQTLLPGESEVVHLELARTGDRLVTVSKDGAVRLWHVQLSPRALIEEARRLSPRCLDPGARVRVFLERTPPRWCLELKKWPYQSVD